jgi:hypothetical protein
MRGKYEKMGGNGGDTAMGHMKTFEPRGRIKGGNGIDVHGGGGGRHTNIEGNEEAEADEEATTQITWKTTPHSS